MIADAYVGVKKKERKEAHFKCVVMCGFVLLMTGIMSKFRKVAYSRKPLLVNKFDYVSHRIVRVTVYHQRRQQ